MRFKRCGLLSSGVYSRSPSQYRCEGRVDAGVLVDLVTVVNCTSLYFTHLRVDFKIIAPNYCGFQVRGGGNIGTRRGDGLDPYKQERKAFHRSGNKSFPQAPICHGHKHATYMQPNDL